MDNFKIIESNINSFTKKYYFVKLIRGIVYVIFITILIFIFLTGLENYFYFKSNAKIILLNIGMLLSLISIFIFIIYPILGIVGLRKKLKNNLVNKYIVDFFPEIKDQFINLYELKKIDSESLNYSIELINASINQKINNLKIYDFKLSINAFKVSNYLLGIIIFVLLFVIHYSFNFNQYALSINRLKNYSINYEKPSPYIVNLINDHLDVAKGDDIFVKFEILANEIIEDCYIDFGGNLYKMLNDTSNYYSYKFSNVNNSIDFSLQINEHISKLYRINVIEKPLIKSFSVEIVYPKYINKETIVVDNLSELIVPVGTKCIFKVDTYKVDTLKIYNNSERGDNFNALKKEKSRFEFEKIFMNNSTISLELKNKNFIIENSLNIEVRTVKDEYPNIQVNQMIDSTILSIVYFKGLISDDYGFKNLNFQVSFDLVDTVYELNFDNKLIQQNFFYAFDFAVFKNYEENISYYFKITDNDEINGFKSSVSETFYFKFPDQNLIFEKIDEDFQNLNKELIERLQNSQILKNEISEFQKRLINSNVSEWDKKQIIRNLNDKKSNLINELEQISEMVKKNDNYLNSFNNVNSNLIEKQKQIQELLDNVLSDDIKSLLNDLNKMLEDINNTQFKNFKDKIEYSLDDLNEQLDKNLELLKRFQVEKKLNLLENEIEKNLQKHSEIINNNFKNNDFDSVKKESQKIKDSMKKIKEEYKETKDLNDALKNPIGLLNFEKEMDNIINEYNNLNEQTKENKRKIENSLEKNLNNLNNLSFMFKNMVESEFMKQKQENLNNLIQILNNLLILSFNQEKLLKTNNTEFFTNDFMQNQKNVKDHFSIIQDSLYSLSGREPSIHTFVNNEIVTINYNLKVIEDNLREGKSPTVKINQQIVLTSINNLTLFMSEIIKNIQKQMANSMPGNQNCQNHGNGNGFGSIKDMQESLQKQLEQILKMKKEGNSSERALSNELGKALKQQEMLQKMLNEFKNSGEIGSKGHETLKSAEQILENIKQDIIRNNINSETINRQKEILTRLLESERAESERDKEEKRKGTTSLKQFFDTPQNYFDNKNSNYNFEERLMYNRLLLKPYYQSLFQSFIINYESINGTENLDKFKY